MAAHATVVVNFNGYSEGIRKPGTEDLQYPSVPADPSWGPSQASHFHALCVIWLPKGMGWVPKCRCTHMKNPNPHQIDFKLEPTIRDKQNDIAGDTAADVSGSCDPATLESPTLPFFVQKRKDIKCN